MAETTTMTPVLHRVADRVAETPDTVTLTLVPADGSTVAAVPGQFHMLWAPGVGEVPISVSRVDGSTLSFTVRAVGAVTAALCAASPGDTLGARGPYGRGWDTTPDPSRHLVMIAGGLGLAPLRPLVEAVSADPGRFASVTLLVGARDVDGLLYAHDRDRWATRIALRCTVDVGTHGWTGPVGPVTGLLDGAFADPELVRVAMCGPEIMMRVVGDDLVARGVPGDAVEISLERNMQCGVGHCGHCQLGPLLVCVDGPVVAWSRVAPSLEVDER